MAILIKKSGNAASASGCWESVHVVEVLVRLSLPDFSSHFEYLPNHNLI